MTRTRFEGGRVFDGDRTVELGKTVIVEEQRIVSVCDSASVVSKPDDRVVDTSGKTLMPGMVQAHWHGSYAGLDFSPPPVGLEKPPGYLMLLAAKHARMALERGFTSVIGAATGDALDAQLKAAIADDVVEGPRIMASGRWLITTGDSNDLPDFWWWKIASPGSQRICDGPDEFRKGARQEILEGAEIIKIFCDSGHALLYGSEFTSMTDTELHAVVEATKHRGKKIRAHVTAKQHILACVEAGVDVLDHADGMDAECIDAMVAADTHVCPSLQLTRAILDRLEGEGSGDDPLVSVLKRDFEHMCQVLPEAQAAGVKLMVGDDWGTEMTPHGDYFKEMELYVNEAGIKPIDVLRWATKHGAEAMGMGSDLGTIAEGKLADLVVVRGDPTSEIGTLAAPGAIVSVMKEGQFVTRDGA